MIHLPPCSLCPRLPYRRPIHPDGPIPCRVMLLGKPIRLCLHVNTSRVPFPVALVNIALVAYVGCIGNANKKVLT